MSKKKQSPEPGRAAPASPRKADRSLPWKPIWDFVILAILVLVLYLPTLRYSFVWDDNYLLVRNWMLLPENAHLLWSSPFWQLVPNQTPEADVGFLRPLVTSGFYLERTLFGTKSAWPFHASNVAVYLTCALLVLGILRSWLGQRRWALILGLLFAAHPLHIEAVTFIAGRTDSWVGVFILLIAYVWSRPLARQRWYHPLIVGGSYALALVTKENALMILPWLPALDAWHHKLKLKRMIEERWKIYAALLVLTLIYFIYRYSVLGFLLTPPGESRPILTRLLAVPYITAGFLRLTFFPFQHITWSYLGSFVPGINLPILLACGLLAGFALIVYWLRRDRMVWLGLATWLLFLLPATQLPGGHTGYMAFGILFIPILGALLFFLPAIQRWSTAPSYVALGLAGILLISWSAATLLRNPVWSSDRTLYATVIDEAPGMTMGFNGLGIYYLYHGQADSAAAVLEEGVKRDPKESQIRTSLGWAWLDQERYTEAAALLKNVVAEYPRMINARINLCEAYIGLKDWSAAEVAAKELVEMAPSNPRALAIMGKVLNGQGKTAEAMAAFQKCRELDPTWSVGLSNMIEAFTNPPQPDSIIRLAGEMLAMNAEDPVGWNAKGHGLLLKGEFKEATEALEHAHRLSPEDRTIRANLGWAWASTGRLTEAKDILEGVIRENPKAVDARVNLCQAYLELKDIDAAQRTVNELIALAPDNGHAQGLLGSVLAAQGKIGEALVAFKRSHELDPNSALPLVFLVMTYSTLSQPESLGKYAEILTTSNPQVIEGWNGLGLAQLNRGRTAQAIATFQKALSINGRNYPGLKLLLKAYRQSGQLDLARKACADWISANPDDPNTPEVRRMAF